MPIKPIFNQKAEVVDPIVLCNMLWPNVHFYDKQRDIIYSVVHNDETIVYAGNMLGKDFVAAFIVLWFFLTRSPCRIITTSADHAQLEAVLWGEIRNFIQTSSTPLEHDKGGPLIVNHLHIRKMVPVGEDIRDPKTGRHILRKCGLSYIEARVAKKGESILGHHVADRGDGIPRTLFVADEASGVDDTPWSKSDTWAKRKLAIGNCFPCENFFKKAIEAGDLKAKPEGLYSFDPGHFKDKEMKSNLKDNVEKDDEGEHIPTIPIRQQKIYAETKPQERITMVDGLPRARRRS